MYNHMTYSLPDIDFTTCHRDDVSRNLGRILRTYGFDHFTHVSLRGFTPADQPPPHMTIVTPSWERHYQTQNLAAQDPVLQRCIVGTAPLVFIDLNLAALAAPQRATMEQARDFRMDLGLSVPVHGPNNTLTILSAYHDGTPHSFREAVANLPLISLTAQHLHEHLMAQAIPAAAPPTALTPREVECLSWISQGKTAWEISVILKVSERTVKFHLNNLMRKLGVHSRTHAVARAISLGLASP